MDRGVGRVTQVSSIQFFFNVWNFFNFARPLIRRNLTSTDVKFWGLKSVPALKGFKSGILQTECQPLKSHS